MIAKNYGKLHDEQHRLLPLLRKIGKDSYVGPDYSKVKNEGGEIIRPEMINLVRFWESYQ